MNLSTGIKFGALIAVLISLAAMLCACNGSAPVTTPTGPTTNPTPKPSFDVDNVVQVVYFHREQRCAGCIYAGDTTQYTIETYFGEELASGRLVFQVLNVQDEANAAIREKYGAYTSSLFINEVRGGIDHIEEVTGIWFLLHNDDAFINLVKNEIEKHLGE